MDSFNPTTKTQPALTCRVRWTPNSSRGDISTGATMAFSRASGVSGTAGGAGGRRRREGSFEVSSIAGFHGMKAHAEKVAKRWGIPVVHDTPENILERITFYDIDSRRIEKHLTGEERVLYLKEIKADISYIAAHTNWDAAIGGINVNTNCK